MPPFHTFQAEWADDDDDSDLEIYEQVTQPRKQKYEQDASTDVEIGDVVGPRTRTSQHSPTDRVPRERHMPWNSTDISSRESSVEFRTIEEEDEKWLRVFRGDNNKEAWLELGESDVEADQQTHVDETIEVSHGETTLPQGSEVLPKGTAVMVEQLQNADHSSPSPTGQRPRRTPKSQHERVRSASAQCLRGTTGSSRAARPHRDQKKKPRSSHVALSGAAPQIHAVLRSSVPVYEININGILVMRHQNDSWVNATSMLRAIGVDNGTMRRKIIVEIGGPQRVTNGGHPFYQGTWVPLATARDLATVYDTEDAMRPLLEMTPEAQPASSREARLRANGHPVPVSPNGTDSPSDDSEPKNPPGKNAYHHGRLANRDDWGNSSDSEDDLPLPALETRSDPTRPIVTSDLPNTQPGLVDRMDGHRKRLSDPQDRNRDQSFPPAKRARIKSLSALPAEMPRQVPESRIVRYSRDRRDNEREAAKELRALLPPRYLSDDNDVAGLFNPTTRIIKSAIAFIADLADQAIDVDVLNCQRRAKKDDGAGDSGSKINDYNQASSESLTRAMIQTMQRPETNIITALNQYGHEPAAKLGSQHVGPPRKSADQYSVSKTAIKNRAKWNNFGDLERWFRRREMADNTAVSEAMQKIKQQPVWVRLTEDEQERIRNDERRTVLQRRFDQGKSHSYFMAQLVDVGKQCGVTNGDMLSLVLSKQPKAREAIIELFNGVVEVGESGRLALNTPTKTD
ncbi:transcriptional regulator swi6 [Rhinocladiella similis]